MHSLHMDDSSPTPSDPRSHAGMLSAGPRYREESESESKRETAQGCSEGDQKQSERLPGRGS